MKKLSFGSFPLTEIRKEDRRCLDRYMIKTFSDNISISDAVRNLAVTKQLMYITPDALMQSWLAKGNQTEITSRADRSSNNIYDQVLKRAFYILKEFYSKIQSAPFYKDYIYYPIYVEKIEKTTPMGSPDSSNQYTDVLMNYSFVIISNDLTKNLKIDEIRYDENASLNFLYLFIEFFSGSAFEYSIHDFNEKDLEFLVKLYQFIEKSGKEPINAVLDLYKLLGLIGRVAEGKTNDSDLKHELDAYLKQSDIHELTKYKGLVNHEFAKMLSGKKTVSKDGGDNYRKRFRELLELIFNSEKLNGLYTGVNSSASRGDRHAFLYQTSKYREILNVAGELVDYNSLKCKEVISDDHMDFDFKVESGEVSIETSRQVVAQKYQTFFKDYVNSISDYMEGVIAELISTLGVDTSFNTQVAKERKDLDTEIRTTETDLSTSQGLLSGFQTDELNARTRKDTLIGLQNTVTKYRGGNIHGPAIRIATNDMTAARNQGNIESNNVRRLEAELKILQARKSILGNFDTNTTKSFASEISNQTYKKLSDKVISTLANDLTFIYDDGKRFFTNEKVAEGFIDLANGTGGVGDPSTPDGFDKVVKAAKNKTGEFKDPTPDTSVYDIDPRYMAGEILVSLSNDFIVTAEDAVRAIDDSIRPILANILTEYQRARLNTELKKGTPAGVAAQADAYKEFLLDNFQKNLSLGTKDGVMRSTLNNMLTDKLEMVLRNRFVTRVLANFKRMLRKKTVNKAIAFDQHISQLHPLIGKLMKSKGGSGTLNNECNYFKSFIIDYDMVEQLARLKFITETQKFLDGIINRPPRKLSDPMNRIKTVLDDYLGLGNNPVWIISKSNVYLSMPDTLSLTGTNLISKIPKSELMQVCDIKPSDYWNENKMGKVSSFGNRKIKEIFDKIATARDRIDGFEKEKSGLNSKDDKQKIKELNNSITRQNKIIDRLEDDMQRVKEEDKDKKGQFTPNSFLFGDGESGEPLLTQKEKEELIQNKEQLKDRLVNLNKFDDSEVEELQRQQEELDAKKKQNQPWEFENSDGPTGPNKIPHTYDKEDNAYQEQVRQEDERIRDRDERFDKRNDRY